MARTGSWLTPLMRLETTFAISETITLCAERLGRGARATAENFSLKNQISAYRELLASLQRRRAG